MDIDLLEDAGRAAIQLEMYHIQRLPPGFKAILAHNEMFRTCIKEIQENKKALSSAPPPHPSKVFHFKRLPLEIRLMIYSFADLLNIEEQSCVPSYLLAMGGDGYLHEEVFKEWSHTHLPITFTGWKTTLYDLSEFRHMKHLTINFTRGHRRSLLKIIRSFDSIRTLEVDLSHGTFENLNEVLESVVEMSLSPRGSCLRKLVIRYPVRGMRNGIDYLLRCDFRHKNLFSETNSRFELARFLELTREDVYNEIYTWVAKTEKQLFNTLSEHMRLHYNVGVASRMIPFSTAWQLINEHGG